MKYGHNNYSMYVNAIHFVAFGIFSLSIYAKKADSWAFVWTLYGRQRILQYRIHTQLKADLDVIEGLTANIPAAT